MAEFGELMELAMESEVPVDFESMGDIEIDFDNLDLDSFDLKDLTDVTDIVEEKLINYDGELSENSTARELSEKLNEVEGKKNAYDTMDAEPDINNPGEQVEAASAATGENPLPDEGSKGIDSTETIEPGEGISDTEAQLGEDLQEGRKNINEAVSEKVGYDSMEPEEKQQFKDDAKRTNDKVCDSLESMEGGEIDSETRQEINEASDLGEENKSISDEKMEDLKKNLKDINEKMENLNEKIEKGPEEGKSLSETVKDIFMGLVEVLKILGPIFGMWFMFNLISYVFSECYWIPVNKNCKFYDKDGNELEDWSKLQHTKKRMKKENTQKSFYARLTFQKSDNNAECACNSAAQSFLKVVANADEKDRYGTITTDKDVGDPCSGSGSVGTTPPIACFERGAPEEDERKPMCLTHNTTSNVERNRRAKVACGGYYKKYDCNLSEMINSFAKLADMIAHTNPLDLIKKIIYIIVAIIAVFFVISIVRYILRKKSE
tara:strand:+ start:12747 stop:14222 length:1476 start_codon:yes stop_codon:yes gene_type:complete